MNLVLKKMIRTLDKIAFQVYRKVKGSKYEPAAYKVRLAINELSSLVDQELQKDK